MRSNWGTDARRSGQEAEGWEEKHRERSQHTDEGGGAKTVSSLINSVGQAVGVPIQSDSLPRLG